MAYQILCAGFGGQGVLFIGDLLAQAALRQNLHVTYLPTYGVAMRGGTANCVVTFSEDEVGSPLLDRPQAAILLNQPSMDKFQPIIANGGVIVANQSLVDPESAARTEEVRTLWVAATEIARQVAGTDKSANVVALGAFMAAQSILAPALVEQSFEQTDDGKKKLMAKNLAAFRAGRDAVRGQI